MLLWLFWSDLSWVDQTLCYHKQTGSVDLTQFFRLLTGLRKLRRLNQRQAGSGRFYLAKPHTEKLYM